MLLKIVFRARGTQKESLKQSIMIEKQRAFIRTAHFLTMYLAFLIVSDFPIFSYISRHIPFTW